VKREYSGLGEQEERVVEWKERRSGRTFLLSDTAPILPAQRHQKYTRIVHIPQSCCASMRVGA